MTPERKMFTAMLDRIWKEFLTFPDAKVCRHYAAGVVIQEMEALGIEPPHDVIRAIVRADDETALAWQRPGFDQIQPGLPVALTATYAAGHVAVAHTGGFWGVGATPEACEADAWKAVEECRTTSREALMITAIRSADPHLPVLAQEPESNELVMFYCTQRVMNHLTATNEGCVPWRVVGESIIDLVDEPTSRGQPGVLERLPWYKPDAKGNHND